MVTWLAERSEAAVRDALARVAPLQAGSPLAFEITGQLPGAAKAGIGGELARVLAAMHRPTTLSAVAAIRPSLPPPTPQADTAELRHRLAPLLDEQRAVRVLDFEESSVGDFHYDFRYLPAQEPTLELLRHTVEAYQRISRRSVDLHRVMAWHVRTVCGDALWRTEAQVAMPAGARKSQL